MDYDRAYQVNGGFETDFTLNEQSVPLLGIHNNGRVNRTLATHERIGKTSFSATLGQVLYGKYKGDDACLVVIDFSFRFRSEVACRYSYAEILVAFRRAVDIRNPRKRADDPSEDPRVTNMAPKEVYGILKASKEKNSYGITIPAMFESPIGLWTSIEGHAGKEETEHQENRMEIHGDLYFDDEHDQYANAVTWDLSENDALKDGIFRYFKAAIVLLNPPEQPMWMEVVVKPSVRFSLDPRRLVQKSNPFARLLQKNDDPVLLDGKTAKTGPFDPGCNDFSSPAFPWDKVLQIPKEYEVSQSILREETSRSLEPLDVDVSLDAGAGHLSPQRNCGEDTRTKSTHIEGLRPGIIGPSRDQGMTVPIDCKHEQYVTTNCRLSAGVTANKLTYKKVYRVRGIPYHFTPEILERVLSSHAQSGFESRTSSVHSFTDHPSRREKVAIVSFLGLVDTFSEEQGRTEWRLSCRYTSKAAFIDGEQGTEVEVLDLVVDVHFKGFTTLGKFVDTPDYKAE